MPGAGAVAASDRNAEGVWHSTVTRCSASSRATRSGARATSGGTTTRVPPCSSAPHISHTEKSKA
ncbi:hypothetical protein GCM10009634_78240 [Saccharothrix xinjiangensis]